MSDQQYDQFQHYGTNAERLAFVPDPPPVLGGVIQPIYIWFETDTGNVYLYFTAWVLVSGTAAIPSSIDPFLLMGG